MPINLPDTAWPRELTEDGPREDATILLSSMVNIGPAPHRLLAIRINPTTLAVDYRPNVDEDVYADYQLDELVDDLTLLDDLDASVLVPMGGGHYAVWLMPYVDAEEIEGDEIETEE